MAEAESAIPDHPAVRRIVDNVLGADATEALRERLAGSDLTSLLLDVMGHRAVRRSAGDILRQYGRDRFTRPAAVDPLTLLTMSLRAAESVEPDFQLVETAPLAPLGTHSVIAGISQNRVVSTIRGTEVAADPTNSLALEAAVRRRALLRKDPRSTEIVQLASIDRVVRGQQFEGPRSFAHFTLLGLVSAGRDDGSRRFETESLWNHLRSLVAVCRSCGFPQLLVEFTDLDGRSGAAIESVAHMLGDRVSVTMWPERSAGRSYYQSLCFKLGILDNHETIEVADGGFVDWTQSLLGNRKEQLTISGISLERLTQLAPPGN